MTSPRPALVLRPVEVTDAVLVSTNIAAEDPLPEYQTGVTYDLAQEVMVAAEHAVYRSLVAANVNNAPATSPTKWKRVRTTNRRAMFDVSTLTSRTSSDTGRLQVVLRPGAVGGLVMFGLRGATVDVEQIDYLTGELLASQTGVIADQYIDDWYEYLTAPFADEGDLAIVDLPLCNSTELRINVWAREGESTVWVRALATGPVFTLGVAEEGLSTRRLNASKLVTDPDDGQVTIEERPVQRRTDLRFTYDADRVNKMVALFDSLENVVCAWLPVPDGGYESLNVLGLHRDTTHASPKAGMQTCTTQLLGVPQ